MDRVSQWKDKIFNANAEQFETLAIDIFHYQYGNNPVYREYAKLLRVQPGEVKKLDNIPFLPIRFFKSQLVQSGDFTAETIFESSGTTGMERSRHFIKDLSLYQESFLRGFEIFYGLVTNYCILGLLPSYLERKNSSLAYMVDRLIRFSLHPSSGFYLDEWERLFHTIEELESKKQKTLLIGVSFALLDFAEKHPLELNHTTIIETGGMKGRRREMIREELHSALKEKFGPAEIHAEYGMTELLTQAWSRGSGRFQTPPWMKVMARDEEDPQMVREKGSGVLNIIDLANIHSCSFIGTDDAGRIWDDSFEVLGRIDNTDLRGCSLLVI